MTVCRVTYAIVNTWSNYDKHCAFISLKGSKSSYNPPTWTVFYIVNCIFYLCIIVTINYFQECPNKQQIFTGLTCFYKKITGFNLSSLEKLGYATTSGPPSWPNNIILREGNINHHVNELWLKIYSLPFPLQLFVSF